MVCGHHSTGPTKHTDVMILCNNNLITATWPVISIYLFMPGQPQWSTSQHPVLYCLQPLRKPAVHVFASLFTRFLVALFICDVAVYTVLYVGWVCVWLTIITVTFTYTNQKCSMSIVTMFTRQRKYGVLRTEIASTNLVFRCCELTLTPLKNVTINMLTLLESCRTHVNLLLFFSNSIMASMQS